MRPSFSSPRGSSRRALLVAIVALLLSSLAFAEGASRRIRLPANLRATTDPCNLQCWLNKLVIHIPDQTFDVALGATGSIKNGVCTGILIGNLDSSLVGPNGAPTGVHFVASGLSIACTMDWAISGLIPISGNAAATVANSGLDATLQLQHDADGLASSASMPSCSANIQIASLTFSGDLKGLLNVFKGLVTSILQSQLKGIICDEMSKAVSTQLTGLLQKVDNSIRPYLKPQPPAMPPKLPPNMVDLSKNSLMGAIDYVLDEVVGVDGVLNVNKVMNRLTKDTGNFSMSNIGFAKSFPVSTLGTIGIELKYVNLTGLNTWGDLTLLVPSGPTNLTSHTSLKTLSIAVGFGINVTVGSELGNAFLHEDAAIFIRVDNNRLSSDLQLGISRTRLDQLSDNQMTVAGCLASTLAGLNLTQLDFSFVLSQLEILAANGGTEAQLDGAINNVFALLTSSFQVAIPAFFNGVVAGPVRGLANAQFEKLITGQDDCYEPAEVETFNRKSTAAALGGATGVFAVFLPIVLFVAAAARRRRGSKAGSVRSEELTEPLITEDAHVYGSNGDIAKASAGQARGNKWLTALLFCPKYHPVLRYGIVFFLLCNMALFISSNTSVGASVYVYITVDGSQTKLPSLFDFTLANSVHDMWVAKVYALSLLIAVFSGAWPYLKLLILLLCWVLPVGWLPRRRREQCLMALDVLGKWSLIDAFVMTLMMVAFHFDIIPPASKYVAPGSVAIEAYVEPHWGIYSFMISTMMSLTVTHVILACHRKELVRPMPQHVLDVIESHEREALHSHAFKTNRFLARCPRLVTVTVTSLLSLAIGLVVAGSVLDSFQFQFKGAFKLLLDFLHENANQAFSIVSLGSKLPESAYDPNSFGVRFIQATWFLFAIVLPLCYLVFLLTLWLVPMTPRVQHKMFHVTEVFNAWSALEVVVVSVIAALLELRQFAQFIIGDKCTKINPLLEQYLGDVLEGDAKCFDVVTTLDSGCWLLFCACLIYIVVGLLVQLACHKALKERESKLMMVADDEEPLVQDSLNHAVEGGQ